MTKWKNDAGHGGGDPGVVYNGNIEKVYTLEASNYVNRRLQEHGISSSTTRSKDIGLSNSVRTNKMKSSRKGMSHHYNGGGGHGAEFIKSIHSDGIFEQRLVEEFENAGYPLRNKPVYDRTYPGNNKLDYYFMHRETGNCRTTIIEYDFVDGKNSEIIKNKNYRIGMYECVVKAVCRDEGIKYKAPGKVDDTPTLYRVVTGSFKQKQNAEKRVKDLQAKGFDSFIDIIK